jgi:hypothetical protein
MFSHFKYRERGHPFTGFDFDMKSCRMIDTATKTIVVMARNPLPWNWGIWVSLWNLRITRDTQRVNLAANSFHVL